jgi:hypothetical protein
MITNKDGGVIPLAVADVRAAMSWEYGPGISQTMMSYADKLEVLFNTLSGFHDVLQGRAEINSSVPSGRSIDELTYASQTRLRQMLRSIKQAWRILGKKIIQEVHQSYTTEDVVRITGADAEAVNSVLERSYREAMGQLAQAGAASVEDFQNGLAIYWAEKGVSGKKDGQNGMYLGYTGNRLGDPNDIEVRVNAGADVPKNKLDVAQVSRELFAAGQIDPQTMMEAIDYPLRDKALERNSQWQMFQQWQAQMQAQQAAQAQAAPQGPAVPGADVGGPMEGQPMDTGAGLQEPTGAV